MAGYHLNALHQEHQPLPTERAMLEMEEARLVSPERLQKLAKDHAFIDPTPERTIYLAPKEGSMAMNRH